MTYQPREGVDYITDLYQIAAVPQDAGPDVIKQALNARALEYHPDRLEGLAPEFQEKGERMARLLNRARVVLLDTDRRSEYDEILAAWDGPISGDGIPAIRLDDSLRAEMEMRSPEEIEAVFAAQREQVTIMTKHNPKQQALLARMFEAAEGEDTDEIREAYDAALFAEDQVLAIEETERGRLVGLTGNGRYETSLGYTEKVQLALEQARGEQTAEYTRRALGGVSTKLALLAGESGGDTPVDVSPLAAPELPHYFDAQAERIAELAAEREALLAKRLEIFRPAYPVAEMQTQAHPNFAIGVTNDEESGNYTWIGFTFDKDAADLSNVPVPAEIRALLEAGEFERVYESGFNILSFVAKEQIDLHTLLEEAYNKHLNRYFPGALG